ncbi:MAG: N-acetyltransferase DgcN [Alphaproteobacteria bacterium]
MAIEQPYLMFLGDAADQLAAKVANGVAMWRPDWCKGQLRLDGCNATLGLPDMTLQEAVDAGCKTVVVGVANRGGIISETWKNYLVEALELGMDIASGLHNKVADVPEIAAAAKANGRQLFDVRHVSRSFDVAKGTKRPGKRLLTVGTDCSIGKMFSSLAIERELLSRGMKADFRATGQTGIFIAGTGVSVDAVIADFISGAAEWLGPDNDEDHWDVYEGQGSLFHASFAGVSLGLLHGAQPDALVMCHEPTRTHMRGLPQAPIPAIKDCIKLNEECGRLTNPNCRVIGISVNTVALSDAEAADCVKRIEDENGLPATDAYRFGAGKLVDAL